MVSYGYYLQILESASSLPVISNLIHHKLLNFSSSPNHFAHVSEGAAFVTSSMSALTRLLHTSIALLSSLFFFRRFNRQVVAIHFSNRLDVLYRETYLKIVFIVHDMIILLDLTFQYIINHVIELRIIFVDQTRIVLVVQSVWYHIYIYKTFSSEGMEMWVT